MAGSGIHILRRIDDTILNLKLKLRLIHGKRKCKVDSFLVFTFCLSTSSTNSIFFSCSYSRISELTTGVLTSVLSIFATQPSGECVVETSRPL